MSKVTDKLKLLDMIALSPNATGIDISYWQSKFDIDKLDTEKILAILDFVFLRIGYGSQDGKIKEDHKFREFWQELVDHPEILRGLYWYFSSHSSWEEQRDAVFEILDSLNGHWEMFALDFESLYNKKSAGFALSAVRFMKAVQKRYPGKRVLLYAGKYDYSGWLKFYTDEVDDWALWHAQYPWQHWYNLTAWFMNWWGGIFAKLAKSPSLAKSRDGRYEIWQVAAKTLLGRALGVGSLDVDINISRRTLKDFTEWLGVPERLKTDQPEPPPEPDDDTMTNEERLDDHEIRIANLEGDS
jgi:hypothetical protein